MAVIGQYAISSGKLKSMICKRFILYFLIKNRNLFYRSADGSLTEDIFRLLSLQSHTKSYRTLQCLNIYLNFTSAIPVSRHHYLNQTHDIQKFILYFTA